MKPSTPLTDADRAQLLQILNDLTANISVLAKYKTACERHHRRLETLEEELRALEKKAQSGSVDASMRITGVLNQKVRVAEAIEEANSATSYMWQPFRVCVDAAVEIVGRICSNDFTAQVTARVQSAISPFYNDAGAAGYAARQTDAMQNLGRFLCRFIGSTTAELLPLAEEYSQILTRLLAGEDVWEFQGATPWVAPSAA
jgi:hypothetical protein